MPPARGDDDAWVLFVFPCATVHLNISVLITISEVPSSDSPVFKSAIIEVIICFKKLIAINSKYLNAAEYLLRS